MGAGLLLAAGLAILCLVWTITVLSQGHYLTAVVSVGLFWVFVSLSIAVVILLLGKVRVDATFDDEGTVFRIDPVLNRLYVSAIVCMVVSVTLGVIMDVRGALHIPETPTRVYWGFAAAAVVVGILSLRPVITHGTFGYLMLSPAGFEIDMYSSASQGTWRKVTEIADHKPEGRLKLRYPIVFVMQDASVAVLPYPEFFTPKGRAMYWLTRFYWQHSECRGELVDGGAIERLRNEQFDLS